MNWRTMVAEIQDIVTGISEDRAKRCIIRALEKLRVERAFFNQAEWTINTVSGTNNYDVQTEFAGQVTDDAGDDVARPVVDIQMILSEPVGGGDRLPVLKRSVWSMQEHNPTPTETTGRPTRYSWNADELLLWPTPDGIYPLNVFVVFDVGSPKAAWSGTAWSYVGEAGTTIGVTYESLWMQHAPEVVVAFAAADAMTRYAVEMSTGRVEALLQQAQAHLADIRRIGENQDAQEWVSPWFAGERGL